MAIDYRPPPPTTRTNHDHIYTTLLGVLAFFTILGIVSLVAISRQPRINEEARTIFKLPIYINSCFTLAILSVLILRLAFPRQRRWPTLGLNIILLIYIPFGTALAIYGLLKADKPLRDVPPPLPPQSNA